MGSKRLVSWLLVGLCLTYFAMLYAYSAYADTPLINCNGMNQALQSTQNPPKYGCTTIATGGTPGGASGQVQYNNAGAFGGFTLGGDCTLNVSTGAITCTKTNNVSFAPSATTDTTNATNISSGTLAAARGGAGTTSGILKANGSGLVSSATAGTDYQAPITLTTTGTSGAATFSSNTLNIPQYAGTTYTANNGITLTGSTFGLTPVTANTVLGALTATVPSALSLPSCTDTGGNHINWTAGVGFSCGTSDSHVGTVTSIATTGPISGGTITATGTISCPTCATTTNGGAITGTAPIAVSAAGAISISGTAGQIPNGTAGTFTATPTLGASGTLGTVTMGNASSGTITLSPAAGALGASTVLIPAGSDTLVNLTGAQTLTNKSISGSQINSGTVPAAQLPLATTGAFGAVKPDGTSITISSGVISAAASGGTVTTTGSPASGNLAAFSGGTSITNTNLSGDATTSGTSAVTVGKVNGVTYGTSPSTNTVPVVTGANTVTYQTVPNAALANASTTVNGQTCTLGSSCTAPAAAGTLTGSTLAAGVTGSSLTSTGTLTGGATGAGFTVALGTSTLTGQVPIANGGTGQTTATTAFNALSPMTLLGDLIYGGASGAGTRLAGQTTTTKQYLSQTGTGTISAIPAWAQVAFGDLSGQATNAQLATQTANTVLGALTATTPSGLAVPSCSTATSALRWTTGSGFSCGTITPGNTITSPGATLAVGGTSTATTLDIDLTHANTWTAQQQINTVTGTTIGFQVRTPGTSGINMSQLNLGMNPTISSTINAAFFNTNYTFTSSFLTTIGINFGGGRTADGSTIGQDTYSPSTAVNVSAAKFNTTFSPSASSPSYNAMEINPTINGTSSGTVNALAIATKTNTLTGGTINLINAGTTTTDNFTGYTSKFLVDTVGTVKSPAHVSTGTKFTTSGGGCTVSTTTGGATAGSFTTSTLGTCTTTITMNGATGLTAPNGWSCWVNDITSGVSGSQTASSATTATIKVTTTAGDTVNFGCIGF